MSFKSCSKHLKLQKGRKIPAGAGRCGSPEPQGHQLRPCSRAAGPIPCTEVFLVGARQLGCAWGWGQAGDRGAGGSGGNPAPARPRDRELWHRHEARAGSGARAVRAHNSCLGQDHQVIPPRFCSWVFAPPTPALQLPAPALSSTKPVCEPWQSSVRGRITPAH